MTSVFWIFDARVRNIYLFWRRHDNIIADFLFNKLLSLSFNISSFSFIQRKHLFDWGLHALNWFLTAYLTFALEFWVCNSVCQILFLLYTGCFLEGSCGLRDSCSCWYNYIFGRTGLLAYLIFFLLCVLIFDFMLDIHE